VEFGFCAVVAVLAALLVLSYPRVTVVDLLVPLAIAGAGGLVFKPWSDPLGADVRAGRVEAIVGAPSTPKGDVLRGVAWALLGQLSNLYWVVGRPGKQLVAIGRSASSSPTIKPPASWGSPRCARTTSPDRRPF
jgi:hypothetical protein